LNQTLALYVLIALALVTANLPFLTERLFGVVPVRRAGAVVAKPFWLRLLELAVFYVLVGALGFAFEASLGNPFPQGWQFYAITASLFLVFAYPGFVYRYLRRGASAV
jgi:Na+(H+)/acetate symporter ActP